MGGDPTRLGTPVVRPRAVNPDDTRRAGDLKRGEAHRIRRIATPSQPTLWRRAVTEVKSIQFTARPRPIEEVGQESACECAPRRLFPQARGFMRSCIRIRWVPIYTPSSQRRISPGRLRALPRRSAIDRFPDCLPIRISAALTIGFY